MNMPKIPVMRIACLSLLVLNLIFFAWARWVDVPAPPSSALNVPPLRLASPGNGGSDTQLAAATHGANGGPMHCRSLGPFPDSAAALSAASALSIARTLKAQPRSVSTDVKDGYWVYVNQLKDAAASRRVVAILNAAGIRDAVAIEKPDQADRVAVGIFSEEERAERRAAQVKKLLGLTPVIEPHERTETTYWLDMNIADGGDPDIADLGHDQGVIRAADALRVEDCPATTSSAG